MAKQESIHEGHRERLKKRFWDEGLDGFNDYQVLELLLFYCIPRKDTNPIAHDLIRHFGSLSQVLEASPAELLKVEGIGENAAAFISLLNSFYRYYRSKRPVVTIVDSPAKCESILGGCFLGHRNEVVYLMCLDAKCKLLCCKEVGEGSVNSAAVPIRRIVEAALGANATSVVLAHNHPSGLATPSVEDQLTTRQLAAALSAVDILLVDHLVFAGEDCKSLRKLGLYHPDDCRMFV